MSAHPPRKRKQKVAIACDFCRRRKLGCNSGSPCNKCSQYGRDCFYSERPVKERPSNARIALLTQQNAELLSRLQSPSTLPGSVAELEQSTSVRDTDPFHDPSSASTGRPRASQASSHLETINFEAGRLAFGDIAPGLGMQLLSGFWNRQHHTGTVVYRPVFMRDIACQGLYFTPLLLNAMLFVASKHSPAVLSLHPQSDLCEGGMVFRQAFERTLYDKDTQILCKSRVTTIQALLLMSDALFSWCDERSLSWHYLGLAISMIIDLGIHSTRSEYYRLGSVEGQEVGRRLFWAAFIADKVQSTYQGRQSRLRHADGNLPISFLDEFDELEPFNTVTYVAVPTQTHTPSRGVTTFEQTCKLSVIAEDILSSLYVEKASSNDINGLWLAAQRLERKLTTWKESLPMHFRLEWNDITRFNVLPHTLSLMTMYHSLLILLHRPFVSGNHIATASNSSVRSAFSACTNAAFEIDEILRLYVRHFCIKSCPYFLSYATYASGTIHTRLAAQWPTGSRAHQSLRFCLEVLSEQQKRCHAPRKSIANLLELMKRLNVDVGKTFTAAKSRTEGIGGCQLEDPLLETLQEGSMADTPELWEDTTTNFEYGSTDFDLDAIMRTFNFSPQEGLPVDMDANGDGPIDENYNRWFNFDPLFGLDTSVLDADTGCI